MGKNGVDGVYSADPRTDETAVKFDTLTHLDVLQRAYMLWIVLLVHYQWIMIFHWLSLI